jgi:hypothetical protein
VTKAELLHAVNTHIQEASHRYSDEECGSVNEALANRDESLWRKVRALVEQLEEPCQCPAPEPALVDDPKAAWRFDGEEYTRATKEGNVFSIGLYGHDYPVYYIKMKALHIGYRPTLEAAMGHCDQYAEVLGGWAD